MIYFELSAPKTAELRLTAPTALEVGFHAAVTGGAAYTGNYEVTPKIYTPVILPTKSKTMLNDVKVLKIPQYEVSNDAGGNTLIMGDDYFGESIR